MASPGSPPLPPPPDQWPPKYGYPDTEAPDLPRDQSCYTPIRPSFPRLSNASGFPVDLARIDAIEHFQRTKLMGFTTQDLVDLDVITDAILKSSTLRTDRPVHRIFHSLRWEKQPSLDHPRVYLYDLPKKDNLSGTWTFSNPLVQEAIYPALRIATQVMDSVYLLPWFTALMDYRGMTPISASRVHKDDIVNESDVLRYLKGFAPVATMTPQMLQKAEAQFNTLVVRLVFTHNYQLGFSKPGEEPWTGKPDPDDSMGMTTEDTKNNIFTWISYGDIEALLRPDLTSCERMGLDWHLANTLVHEACHALYKTILMKHVIDTAHEPYFENQPVAELGYAMERVVFGGVGDKMMIGRPRDLSIGYWLKLDNSSIDMAFRSLDPLLTKPLFSLIQTQFPIKAEFFENVQQDDYWVACIAVYGWPALQARNIQEGVKINYKGKKPKNRLDVKTFDIVTEDRIAVTDLRINGFRIKLANYTRQAAGTLTAIERRNIKITTDIIQHSVYEEVFWTRSVETREFLDAVVDSLEFVSRGRTLAERRGVMNEILIFLDGAGRRHSVAIQAFNNLGPELQREDRWEDLLRWNTGARTYAKGCYDLIENDPDYLSTAEVMRRRVGFEFCRMLLFAPDDTPGIPGYSEQTLITAIDRNLRLNEMDLLEGNLEVLNSLADGSLYIEAVVLQSEGEKRYKEFGVQGLLMDQQAVTDTFNKSEQAFETFTGLRSQCFNAPGSAKIRGWVNNLQKWITRADAYMNICRERQQQINGQLMGQPGDQATA